MEVAGGGAAGRRGTALDWFQAATRLGEDQRALTSRAVTARARGKEGFVLFRASGSSNRAGWSNRRPHD